MPHHSAALLVGTYVLAGLIRYPRGPWRAVVLAVLPTLAAVWLIRFAWPGGTNIVLVFVVSMAGYHAHEKVQKAAWWLVAQVGTAAALVALTVWAGISVTEPPLMAAGAVLLAGLVVTIEWGGAWVGRAIRPFSDALTEPSTDDDGVGSASGLPGGFPDGGKMIGRLERLLIFLFVLAAAPTAIGFLVTAKSILRFREIKDHNSQKQAEYIIIGTLMSFGFALVTSYLTRLALMALLPESMLDACSIGGALPGP